jgi:hypothetical protein
MGIKVITKAVIDGKPCSKVFQKGDLSVYQVDINDCSEGRRLLYFAKGENVLFKQDISAGCGQNVGYISGILFQGVD